MRKLKFKQPYRHFFKAGDVGEQNDTKAKELVKLGYADYVDVEKEAPANKEVKTRRKVGGTCDVCGKGFTVRGLKTHLKRAHGL